MKPTERAKKIIALSRLFEGNATLVRALKPQLVLDLNQFSPDELDTLRRLQESLSETEKAEWDLPKLETYFGRPLQLIPDPGPFSCAPL